MPRFLHVGCGRKPKDKTTPVLATWDEVRLDINPAVSPDIVADMTDMSAVASASMDAVYAHHAMEHLYPHQVAIALAEFQRVLAPEGFAILASPDLQAVAKLVAEDRLWEPAYTSPAGPITPHDMLFGLTAALAGGVLHMAHHCGFTARSMTRSLQSAGFKTIVMRRHGFNLTAYALKAERPTNDAMAWARTHYD